MSFFFGALIMLGHPTCESGRCGPRDPDRQLLLDALLVNIPVRAATGALTLLWIRLFGFVENNPLAQILGPLPAVSVGVALGAILPVAFAFLGGRLRGSTGLVARFLSLYLTAFNVFDLYWDACFTALAAFAREPFRLWKAYSFYATALSAVFGLAVAVLWEVLQGTGSSCSARGAASSNLAPARCI